MPSINNTKKAVALLYGEQTPIPKITATGKDRFAFAIIQKAKEYNIPIFQNKELVDSLINLDVNDEIDVDSYLAVAKILIWLNDNENKMQLSK
ncbi:hypothetical protein CCY99_02650 [Helicobacter sp. 16-1353]|uniref:EscU/YscU/HrcU family type III secretion system export apparatus switch protein n=1 Tax=Helicobacter sp. 16-1353 TaxID=2004996 RepID=UPI000DCF3D86|nr:EscU/YscU/HrcU family type III secretion system export apparatus switch protein [Helicobacter sp. 16-1353]RAX54680.1 hypothetical protein CCY99_02650 [Helicobacter sp. 16-1353]